MMIRSFCLSLQKIFVELNFMNLSSLLFMDFQPQFYKTNPLSLVLRIESVMDKRGNLRYCVTMCKGTKDNVHYLFEHLSSAIDFVNSNFK